MAAAIFYFSSRKIMTMLWRRQKSSNYKTSIASHSKGVKQVSTSLLLLNALCPTKHSYLPLVTELIVTVSSSTRLAPGSSPSNKRLDDSSSSKVKYTITFANTEGLLCLADTLADSLLSSTHNSFFPQLDLVFGVLQSWNHLLVSFLLPDHTYAHCSNPPVWVIALQGLRSRDIYTAFY